MTDHAALLATVCAAPADDAPRLILADWYDEHGQPERAEFIRVQCELARRLNGTCQSCGQPIRDDRVADGCPCNSPRGVNHGIVPAYVCTCPECDPQQTGSVRRRPADVAAFYDRSRDLLAAHGERWAREELLRPAGLVHPILGGSITEEVVKWEWSRGFISHVTLDAATLLGRASHRPEYGGLARGWEGTPGVADRLAAVAPVEKITITDMPIYPSGGNDTYYVGGLGAFPQEYWRRLDNHRTRSAALAALSAAAVAHCRRLVNLPELREEQTR